MDGEQYNIFSLLVSYSLLFSFVLFGLYCSCLLYMIRQRSREDDNKSTG